MGREEGEERGGGRGDGELHGHGKVAVGNGMGQMDGWAPPSTPETFVRSLPSRVCLLETPLVPYA